ncbi:MAG: hypothetical protein ACRDJO_12905 [Actinomycetota bacterium]
MRSRHPPLALCLALSLLLGAAACSKDDGKPAPGEPSPSAAAVGPVAFKATSVTAVDAGDRAQANDKANQVAAQVVEFLNAYYTIAFTDPAKWGGGAHAELANLFREDVRAQVPAQLQGLALGDLSPLLESVSPGKAEVAVRVLVTGDDLATPAVHVVTAFEGSAVAKDEEDGPVKVTHTLNALLTPGGTGFQLAGGQAELRADTAAGASGSVEHSVSWGDPL